MFNINNFSELFVVFNLWLIYIVLVKLVYNIKNYYNMEYQHLTIW